VDLLPKNGVDAMIAVADRTKMPRRLVLGSTAFTSIGTVLRARLTELEAHRDVTLGAELRS